MAIWRYADVTDELFFVAESCLGAFMAGDASGYNGTSVVARSVGLKTPIVYVSLNYRLNCTLFFLKVPPE